MPSTYLPDRSLIRVSGADAQDFLHNLVTTDIVALESGEARPGALLTPQGKILFDFMISRDGEAFVIEIDREQREAFIRRLTMYRLRAAVEITALPDEGVTVSWGDDAQPNGAKDVRFAKAGTVLFRIPGKHADADGSDYDALRIASGIAVSGRDYALQDAFPHDVLMDLNDGLSFRKGCYVGQEVVSRMQHRGTARRRVAIVTGESALPESGTELTANGKPLGTLGSVHGDKGLAIIRTDRAGEAMAEGTLILAADIPVSVALPAWSGLAFSVSAEDA